VRASIENDQTGGVTPQDTLELADRFFKAIEAGDTTTLAELYSPDVKVWHNFDQSEQDRDQNLKVLGWLTHHVPDMRYEEIRREVLPDGFLQQHVLRGTAPDGTALEVPAILRIYCADGIITRVEEYLDTAQTQALNRR
jgi:ketosteroid isomerase-like protein